MSRPRPFCRAVPALLVAVLAVLLGGTAPAAAGTVLPPAGPAGRAATPAGSGTPGALLAVAGHPATAAAGAPGTEAAPAAGTRAVPAAGTEAAAAPGPAVRSGGPSCAPGAPDHGGTPAVPARAGGDHAQVPPGRPAPPAARPHAGLPVRVPVRGPDRPAPGPVELSVMRV
ncbi:hypothetical protein [Streptomyces sp. NRRL S-378]|uniref:hypothetical protein n=1 Tax=Streptomyces sp. NRRL S-378 TaxID=1463904 RepID=UPI0004C936F7|nr:hypothetical protein [Streptomyces sp. NRRL S-378]